MVLYYAQIKLRFALQILRKFIQILANVRLFVNDNLGIEWRIGTNVEIPEQDLVTESISGLEFSGELARAAGQGAKFALILAMLEQNVLSSDVFEPQQAPDNPYASVAQPVSNYPQVALSASDYHWSSAAITGELIGNAYLASARLWQAMHPLPLSLVNDVSKINNEVISNCDLPTQRRFRLGSARPITVDETKLYDILNELQGAA